MPLPAGTYPVTGPIIEATGGLLPATTDLRDAGAVSLYEGRLRRVNTAGDDWDDIPGHVISATAPSTGLFDGMLWYDTANDALKAYDGSAFNEISGGGGGGGTPQALSRFAAVTTANTTAQALSATYANILEIAATDVFVNVGAFTYATVTNITTITVPSDGLFKVTAHLKVVTGGSARSQVYLRANVLRSGVVPGEHRHHHRRRVCQGHLWRSVGHHIGHHDPAAGNRRHRLPSRLAEESQHPATPTPSVAPTALLRSSRFRLRCGA